MRKYLIQSQGIVLSIFLCVCRMIIAFAWKQISSDGMQRCVMGTLCQEDLEAMLTAVSFSLSSLSHNMTTGHHLSNELLIRWGLLLQRLCYRKDGFIELLTESTDLLLQLSYSLVAKHCTNTLNIVYFKTIQENEASFINLWIKLCANEHFLADFQTFRDFFALACVYWVAIKCKACSCFSSFACSYPCKMS